MLSPDKTTSASFSACYPCLADIDEFVTDIAQQAGLDASSVRAVQTAVDEACSNIIEHAYQGCLDGTIDCQCIDNRDNLTIILSDHGRPFEPEKIQPPDLTSPIEERQVGGLGIHFMRALMDEVWFSFTPPLANQPGCNVVTLIKRKEKQR